MLRWNKKDSETPEVVPERLTSKINYKILISIAILIVSFQAYLYYAFPKPDDASGLLDIVSIINPSIATVFGFYVAKQYKGSKVFGKAYLALALALAMNAGGEIIYGVYDTLGMDTTFTAADIVFYSFYPLVLVHLISNIRFFKPKIGYLTKAWVVAIPIVITSVYSYLSYSKIGHPDLTFFSGLTYVVLSSIVLSGTMLGARIFRQGVLGVAWLVLLIGIILTTTGDIWYGYLDTFDQYTLTHPMNMCYYAGYLVIAYALYKHQKII
ncbi:MAG: histidine kinase [Thaumarchaeota archaeon]|nr:histidine kinase [Nitrososphaerota archaeon]